VTRKGSNGREYGANQRVGVEEAIAVWTQGGAFATFEENVKGSIAPGKLADFVVLRADPRKVAPDAIKDIVIDSTWIGGQSVFTGNATAKLRHPPPLGFFGDGDEEDNLVRHRE
jgi:predicted amidohydrolase YtcJ